MVADVTGLADAHMRSLVRESSQTLKSTSRK